MMLNQDYKEMLSILLKNEVAFLKFHAKMERKIKNLELKKSGNFCFYLCEFLSSKFNLL